MQTGTCIFASKCVIVLVSLLCVPQVPLPFTVCVASLTHDATTSSIVVGLSNGKIVSLHVNDIDKW